MIDERPSFTTASCPICSTRFRSEFPVWHFAHRTSDKRGKKSYMWCGCPHAAKVKDTTPIDDPAEWAKVEAAWKVEAERLFAEKTKGWTPQNKRFHAEQIGVDLPPEAPADQPTTETEK